MRDKGHFIVLGYGDVGKRVTEILKQNNLKFLVVDASPGIFENVDFDFVVGNATSEDVLKKADVENASTIIVSLNDDNDVIFATLIARNLNPSVTIMARANSYKSIDKIYKAGADYVPSISIVAGQMLARMISECVKDACSLVDEDIRLYEGIDIEKHRVRDGDPLIGKSFKELDIRATVGCTIIGVERDSKVITDITPSLVIQLRDVIAVVGGKAEIAMFKKRYLKS
jgi:voltage-gated potassium channel